jgi:hypothetical protein
MSQPADDGTKLFNQRLVVVGVILVISFIINPLLFVGLLVLVIMGFLWIWYRTE